MIPDGFKCFCDDLELQKKSPNLDPVHLFCNAEMLQQIQENMDTSLNNIILSYFNILDIHIFQIVRHYQTLK